MIEHPAFAGHGARAREPDYDTNTERLVARLEKVEAELRLKEALLRDADYRARDCLLLASALLQQQAKRTISWEARQALCIADRRMRALAAANAMPGRQPGRKTVQLDALLAQICAAVDGGENAQVAVHLTADPVACPPEAASAAGRVVCEAVINALQHAFPDGRAGRIDVRLRKFTGGMVELTVEDDGIGRPMTGADALGDELIQQSAEILEAVMTVRSEPGSGCRLKMVFGPFGQRPLQ